MVIVDLESKCQEFVFYHAWYLRKMVAVKLRQSQLLTIVTIEPAFEAFVGNKK